MVFVLSRAQDKKKIFFRWYMRNRTSDLRIPRSAALPCIFVFFLCTFFRSYSINKHDAIDTANLSSMQDACHMNLVIDLAHRRVFVVQWQSIGVRIRRSEVRFLMGRNFSLSHARDKTKNIYLLQNIASGHPL